VDESLTDETIKTGVDDLLELLKSVNKIPLIEAAQRLGISINLLQSWVDFLVEEEIIGIEYKFTKPIIYLNKLPQGSETSISEDASMTLDSYKQDFKNRASEKNIPVDKVSFFWQNHVKDAANSKKEFFLREVKKRNLPNTESLWNAYLSKLLSA
jgi:hypothetical protein